MVAVFCGGPVVYYRAVMPIVKQIDVGEFEEILKKRKEVTEKAQTEDSDNE